MIRARRVLRPACCVSFWFCVVVVTKHHVLFATRNRRSYTPACQRRKPATALATVE